MRAPLNELPAVVTCFGFGKAYQGAMAEMLATAREHHPAWSVVAGRSTAPDATFAVEGAADGHLWRPPVPFELDGSFNDWRRITRLKGWWLAEVWRRCPLPGDSGRRRILWIDADARCRSPIAFEVDPAAEVIAGPWFTDPDHDGRYATITTGMLMLQGAKSGATAQVLGRWSAQCLRQIEDLPVEPLPWRDGDQELLTRVLEETADDGTGPELVKLPHADYCYGRDKTSKAPTLFHGRRPKRIPKDPRLA